MLKIEFLVFLAFHIIDVSSVSAPSKPNNLRVYLLDEYSPIVELTWDAPYQSFGRIKYYRIFWGKEKKFLEINYVGNLIISVNDRTSYKFELRAENDVAIGAAATAKFRTNTMERVYPPNRRSHMFENSMGSTILQLSWNQPSVAVSGYRIFYKPLTLMYTGRWRKLDIPALLSIDIPVEDPVSTVFDFHVIANTTTSDDSSSVPFHRFNSQRRATASSNNQNAVDSMQELMITYLNKAPQLWALQAGINAMTPTITGK